ncbi:MAG: DUF1847 domain-containing protein [Myxococcales bacterium]
MTENAPQCVRCSVLRCASKTKEGPAPSFCPTEKYASLTKDVLDKYRQPENQAVIEGWLRLMGRVRDPSKPKETFTWTRVHEVMEYARIRGMKKLGIATCGSLLHESKLLADILEHHGFEVASVACLCGEVNPQALGLPGDIFCNPILQAEVLNQEKTALNIVMGLCVGHDILFLRHSRAETTPLVVRDISLGNNPAAALYQSQGFYKDRFFGP